MSNPELKTVGIESRSLVKHRLVSVGLAALMETWFPISNPSWILTASNHGIFNNNQACKLGS